jgi:hypothetical protein
MKRALVILDTTYRRRAMSPAVNYEFVANVHDEWQIECDIGLGQTIGAMAREAIRLAGRVLQLPLPPHRAPSLLGATGPIPTDAEAVLEEIHHRGGVTTGSDCARAMHVQFGVLASLGFITTETPAGYGRKWRLTSRGLVYLENR